MAKEMAISNELQTIMNRVKREIEKCPLMNIEYFEIVDSTNLKTISSWHEQKAIIGCIAAWAGKIRLIDNLKFSS